jgi:hypothetical protein
MKYHVLIVLVWFTALSYGQAITQAQLQGTWQLVAEKQPQGSPKERSVMVINGNTLVHKSNGTENFRCTLSIAATDVKDVFVFTHAYTEPATATEPEQVWYDKYHAYMKQGYLYMVHDEEGEMIYIYEKLL